MQICWIPCNALSTFADGAGKGALPKKMHLQESVLPMIHYNLKPIDLVCELSYHHYSLHILLFVITLLCITIYYLRLIYKLTYLIILFSIEYFKTV